MCLTRINYIVNAPVMYVSYNLCMFLHYSQLQKVFLSSKWYKLLHLKRLSPWKGNAFKVGSVFGDLQVAVSCHNKAPILMVVIGPQFG